MVDLGIGRIQDFQNTLPGVKSTERVHEQKREQKGTPTPSVSEKVEESNSEAELVTKHLKPEELQEEVARLNQVLGSNTRIQFRVNQETDNISIEIIDNESGKVIKTVPPSELHNIGSRVQSGHLLIDNFS